MFSKVADSFFDLQEKIFFTNNERLVNLHATRAAAVFPDVELNTQCQGQCPLEVGLRPVLSVKVRRRLLSRRFLLQNVHAIFLA